MEAETLRALEPSCPLRITMNNGERFDVERPEFLMVTDYEVTVMVVRNGGRRNVTLALMNVASVESTATAT